MKDFRFQVLMVWLPVPSKSCIASEENGRAAQRQLALFLQASLYTVKAFIVLDSDGVRLTAKYYSSEWPTLDKQRSLEEELHKKAQSNREGKLLPCGRATKGLTSSST